MSTLQRCENPYSISLNYTDEEISREDILLSELYVTGDWVRGIKHLLP